MKIDAIKPIWKPVLTLFSLNCVLCGLFAVAGMLSIGIAWIFYDAFGIPFPLFPLTVLGFSALSLLAWGIFGRKIDLGVRERWITALAGVSPLILICAGALLSALAFLAVPFQSGVAIFGPLAIGITAFAASVACIALVIWMPRKPADAAPESTPA